MSKQIQRRSNRVNNILVGETQMPKTSTCYCRCRCRCPNDVSLVWVCVADRQSGAWSNRRLLWRRSQSVTTTATVHIVARAKQLEKKRKKLTARCVCENFEFCLNCDSVWVCALCVCVCMCVWRFRSLECCTSPKHFKVLENLGRSFSVHLSSHLRLGVAGMRECQCFVSFCCW